MVCIFILTLPLLDFSPELAAYFSSYVCIHISVFLVQWLEFFRVHSSHSPRWVRCITWLRFGPSSYASDPMHTIGTFSPNIAMLCNFWCDSFQSNRLAPFPIFLRYDTPSTDTNDYCFNNVSYTTGILVPCHLLTPTFLLSTYWMAGLAHDAAHFFKFLLILVLYSLAMTLFVRFLSNHSFVITPLNHPS